MINIKKLQKKGYEEIDFRLDLITNNKIVLTQEERKNDKRVDIISAFGDIVRTSNIMLGKNKHNIVLENGEYVPLKEIRESLKKTFDNTSKKVLLRNTKEEISSSDAIDKIINMLKNSGEILVGTKHSKIKNQNNAKFFIKGKGQSSFLKKGVFLLGNKGVKLPRGEYINTKELDEILNDFILLENTKNLSFFFFKKKNRKKLRISIFVLISAILAFVGVFIGKGEKNSKKKYDFYENYNLHFIAKEPILESENEILKRVTSQFQVGSKIEVKEGIKYYSSSDYLYNPESKSGTFGTQIRPEGQYEISHLAILDGQNIINTTSEQYKTLYDKITESMEESKPECKSLNYQIHLTDPETGWVNIQDLLDENELEPKQIGTKVIAEKEYKSINKNISLKMQKLQLLRLKRQYLLESLEAKEKCFKIRKKEIKKF